MLRIQCDSSKGIPLPTGSVDAVITSPPYFGLRSYGDSPNEIGSSQSLDQYIDSLSATFAEAMRVLSPTGTLWINIGDTYSGSGGAGGDYNPGGTRAGRPKWKQGSTDLPPRTLCGVPQRLSLSLIAQGWLLRNEIIWAKTTKEGTPLERREDLNHIRRYRPSHESIFFFSKTSRIPWSPDGLTESGTVWRFPTSSGPKGAAPFPGELVRRCLEGLDLPPGSIVLDPFCGSGTTLEVADSLGYTGIGLDLYPPVAAPEI